MISSFTEPYNGFCKIFFYTIAVVITKRKVILRLRRSLIGSFTIPYGGFR